MELKKYPIISIAALVALAYAVYYFFFKDNKSIKAPSGGFTVDLTDPANAALKMPGGSLAINGVVIVNTGSGYVAVSQACTHQGCPVSYDKTGNDFVCPCHGGVFDINGQVVSGPPPSPLTKYIVTVNGNILTITNPNSSNTSTTISTATQSTPPNTVSVLPHHQIQVTNNAGAPVYMLPPNSTIIYYTQNSIPYGTILNYGKVISRGGRTFYPTNQGDIDAADVKTI